MTKAKPANWLERFGHSCFDLLSTFVIRISSFARATNLFTNYELRFTRANRRSRWVKSRAFSGLSNRQSQIVNRKYEGFEIRLPPTAEEPRIHRRGCAHPWAWDWSGDGHVRPHSGGSAVAT